MTTKEIPLEDSDAYAKGYQDGKMAERKACLKIAREAPRRTGKDDFLDLHIADAIRQRGL